MEVLRARVYTCMHAEPGTPVLQLMWHVCMCLHAPAWAALPAAAGPFCLYRRYRNTFDALNHIARTEGARGLFKGLGPTILTNAPYSGKPARRGDVGVLHAGGRRQNMPT